MTSTSTIHATRLRAFGAELHALIDARADHAGDALVALAQLPIEVARVDRALNRFRADSELSRLNVARRVAEASDELLRALATARAVAEATDGLVTPAVHDALCAAGYDASFDSLQALDERAPHSSGAARRGVHVGDWRDVIVDEARRTVATACALDVGGTAKGAFADATAARLSRVGAALVDAGGDIAVSGPRPRGTPWIVEVADPAGVVVDRVALSHGGVATSGRDHRRWAGGHHIIDPRTGAPAVTDVVTATVVATSALEAEVMAKVILLLGRAHGLARVDAQPAFAALVIDEDGRIHRSRTWRGATEPERRRSA